MAQSAWQQVAGQVRPDGTVSKDTALQAFSIAFGALPGVSVPGGEVGRVSSGTGAVRWLVSHWGEITPAQRTEAARLVPELAGLQVKSSGGSAAYVVAAAAPGPSAADLKRLAADAASAIETKTGVKLSLGLGIAVRKTEDSHSDAETVAVSASGGFSGKPARCKISMNPQRPAQGEFLAMVVSHEVWHCFEAQIVGLDRFYSAPSWLIEGQAQWVGYTLHPDAEEDGWWAGYVEHPEYRLFQRTYSAIGFYSQLTHTGKDAWHALIPMLQAKDNVAAFQASGAGGDDFLDKWGSSYFRTKALGDAWVMSGPGLADGPGAKDTLLVVGRGGSTAFSVPEYTNAIHKLASEADVLVFGLTGHARLGDVPSKRDYLVNDGNAFCTKAGGCTCPAGSRYGGPPLTEVESTTFFALTGGPGGTKGTATGKSLDEFCSSKPPVKVRTLQVKGCPPTGWMSQLTGIPYQFDGNGISTGFKVPAGQTWCVYVPVAEIPGSVRLYFWNLPNGKDMDPRPEAKPTVVPGLDKAVLDLNPNSGFGAATIHGQVGRVALGVEVMVKGKPRPDLTRSLLERILAAYLK
ncbi:hypothetical protein [Kribbella sp. NPDC006257]|uniref:hypothetical protein n=1 Tax=Kribbella sp. NPDC006257 TaxID=3156738 RepID=UPI0033AF93B1